MVTIVREALINRDAWEEKDDDDELMKWLVSRALFRTGITGPLDPYINAIVGVRYERDLANIALGPQIGYQLAQLQVILNTIMGRNSENTDTQERKFIEAMWRISLQPLLLGTLAVMPGSTLTTLLAPPAMLAVGSDAAPRAIGNAKYGPERKRGGTPAPAPAPPAPPPG
jgi:hypothetical protein